jgi:hypothetical protein
MARKEVVTTEYEMSRDVLDILLRDRTTGRHILWMTDNYKQYGIGYGEFCEITPKLILRDGMSIIKPRNEKSAEEQTMRVRDKAEVFTPSWVCNVQNNLVDEAWFGRKDVFNTQDGTAWTSTNHVDFGEKNWQKYVTACRLEISCGEAPYLVSRYDTTTGKHIPIRQRIGLLDRKLRVVDENCTNQNWYCWARKAFQTTYGYEWSGDNLLLARQNLLFTFFDWYIERFGRLPEDDKVEEIAEIISWNIWQMDGIKFVVPCSCHEEIISESLFDDEVIKQPCEGCATENACRHNGIYSNIRDWDKDEVLTAVSMIGGPNGKKGL